MGTEKQPIPGPDQTKPPRPVDETGTAGDPHKSREGTSRPGGAPLPPATRPPPD